MQNLGRSRRVMIMPIAQHRPVLPKADSRIRANDGLENGGIRESIRYGKLILVTKGFYFFPGGRRKDQAFDLSFEFFRKCAKCGQVVDGSFFYVDDDNDQPRSLTLRWTPLFGGALYKSDVEVKGASTRLVEAGVQLDFRQRLLTGTLTTDVITGEPGTFAAQATVPPDGEPM